MLSEKQAAFSSLTIILSPLLLLYFRADRGSCKYPIQVDPPASLVLNPCDFWDSTASSHDDVVMLVGPSNTARQVTVETSGEDTELYVYTSCPDTVGGSSQVCSHSWGDVDSFKALTYAPFTPKPTKDAGVVNSLNAG